MEETSRKIRRTSANGNGYGALLAFDHDGEPLGPFSDDDRIVDPRGLAPEPEPGLLFLNSADRVLALDQAGKVVRDTGVIAGLNPGGGTLGPDGRYYLGLRDARTVLALPMYPELTMEQQERVIQSCANFVRKRARMAA